MTIRALTSPAARVAAVALVVALLVIGSTAAPGTEPTAGRPGGRSADGSTTGQVTLPRPGTEGRLSRVPTAPAERRDLRVLSNGCPYDERGVPSCGTLLGAAYGANADPSRWEDAMGHRLGVHRTYYKAHQVDDAVLTARLDLQRQRVPWISFKVPYSWGDMAAGRGDAWARHLAHRLSQLDGPVWVAFHHEPEGDGNIRDWTAMQARLAPIVRQAAPNVAYSIILTGWNQLHGGTQYSLSALWPRDTTIDLVGFDVYNSYGLLRDGVRLTQRTSFTDSYFGRFEEFARAHHVAWGLAETGNTDLSAQVEPRFVQHLYDGVRRHGGVAIAYYNSTLHSTASWQLDGTKERLFAMALRQTPTL